MIQTGLELEFPQRTGYVQAETLLTNSVKYEITDVGRVALAGGLIRQALTGGFDRQSSGGVSRSIPATAKRRNVNGCRDLLRANSRARSILQVELKAQSVCHFFNAPLVSDQITGGRNYYRLPPVRVIFANPYLYPMYAERRYDHVG
jgi:hypothetical protein